MYYNAKGEKIIYMNHTPPQKNCRLHIYLAGTTLPNPNYIVSHNETVPHELEWYQFEYVTTGKGYIEVNGTTYTVSAGDVFFINRRTPNLYYTDKEDLLGKELITVSGNLIDHLMEAYNIKQSVIIRKLDAAEIFRQIRNTLAQIQQIGESSAFDSIELLLHELIQKLSSQQFYPENINIPPAEAILEYIHSHLGQPFSLDDMHQHFFLSKAQLIRIFRSRYHVTPMQYTIMKRIETAMYLLENSGLSIKAIAEMLAFSDSKHFTKTFVRQAGITPSQYRNRITENRTTLLSQLMQQKGLIP